LDAVAERHDNTSVQPLESNKNESILPSYAAETQIELIAAASA